MAVSKAYEEVIDFIAEGTTPDSIVAFRPSDVVRENLEQSRIVLLLISPDFMADDGCCKSEMAVAMEKLELGIVHVVPVRLRSIYMGASPLQDLTWLPERLVTQSVDQDAAFTEIAEGIVKICDGIKRVDAHNDHRTTFWRVWYRRLLCRYVLHRFLITWISVMPQKTSHADASRRYSMLTSEIIPSC